MTDTHYNFEKRFKDSRIVVTGHSGFVGRYMIKRLLELGAEVHGMDRWKSKQIILNLGLEKEIEARFHEHSGNLLDISSIASILDAAEPDYVFHLAAQSFIPESIVNPINTYNTNVMGTVNLLEAIRQKEHSTRFIYAGSSEEYGLVFYSEDQLNRVMQKYKSVFPHPISLPEVPIKETNPLRPMSPYAVSKVSGDYLTRNYYHTYGIDGVVSRAFNHEGAGRGNQFVTSVIARQVMQLIYGEIDSIQIGDVTAFRDWSHISDIIEGYMLLADRAVSGEVYNQGSQRTNSVLSFILLSLNSTKLKPQSMKSLQGDISIEDPIQFKVSSHFGIEFETTLVDRLLLDDGLEITLEHEGLEIKTQEGAVKVVFNPDRFRPSDVPILLASTKKIQDLGFKVQYSLNDIVSDQLNHYLDGHERSNAQG